MTYPIIKELLTGQQLKASWDGLSSTRHFYVLYEYVEGEQSAKAWEAMKVWLREEDGGANLLPWGTDEEGGGGGVPYYPGYKRMPLHSINVSQEGQEPKYIIQVDYKAMPVQNNFGNQWQGMYPPWWAPWKVQTGFVPIEITPVYGGSVKAYRYKNGAYDETYVTDPRVFMTRSSRLGDSSNLDDNGFGWAPQSQNKVVNSNKDSFDNPPTDERHLMTLNLSGARNPTAYPLDGATLQNYIGSVNALPIVVAGNWFDWGVLKIKNITLAVNTFEGQMYQAITIELEADPWTWARDIADKGPKFSVPVTVPDIPFSKGPPYEVCKADGSPFIVQDESAVAKVNTGDTDPVNGAPPTPTVEDKTPDPTETFMNGFGGPFNWDYNIGEVSAEFKRINTGTTFTWNFKVFTYFSDLALPVNADGTF